VHDALSIGLTSGYFTASLTECVITDYLWVISGPATRRVLPNCVAGQYALGHHWNYHTRNRLFSTSL